MISLPVEHFPQFPSIGMSIKEVPVSLPLAKRHPSPGNTFRLVRNSEGAPFCQLKGFWVVWGNNQSVMQGETILVVEVRTSTTNYPAPFQVLKDFQNRNSCAKVFETKQNKSFVGQVPSQQWLVSCRLRQSYHIL